MALDICQEDTSSTGCYEHDDVNNHQVHATSYKDYIALLDTIGYYLREIDAYRNSIRSNKDHVTSRTDYE